MAFIARLVGALGALILVAGCQETASVDVLNACDVVLEIQAAGDPSTGHDYWRVERGETRGLVTVNADWTVLDVWIRSVDDLGYGERSEVQRGSQRIDPGLDSDYVLTLDGQLCPD